MRYILIFLIITGLNLYSQMRVGEDKNEKLKIKKKIEVIASIDNVESSHIISEEETKKVKLLYKIILKKKPTYKLDIIPLTVSNLKSISRTSPFYIISKKNKNSDNAQFKIILFKNVIESFFKDKLLLILENDIQNESDSTIKINSKSFYLKILLHHISHFSGPSIIQNEEGKTVFIDKLLPDNFTIIEELRADMSALVITNQLIIENLLTDKEKKDIYKTHIAYMQYLNKNGSEKQKKFSSIQLNFFKKKGGITHNMITGKISIEMLEFEKIAKNLFKKTTNFEKKADTSKTDINEFIEKFSDIKKEIINKEIKIVSPNGEEKWTLGKNQNINWTASGLANSIKITIWKDGAFVGLIVKDLNPSLGNYSWKVGTYKKGQVKAGTGYKIKIREQGGKSYTTEAESDSTFSLKDK